MCVSPYGDDTPLAMKHVCTTTQALAVQQRRHHYEREPNQTGGGALRPSKVLLMLNLEGDEQISRRNHDACDRVEGPTLADRLATPILNLHRRRQDCDRNLSLQVFRSAGTSPITVAALVDGTRGSSAQEIILVPLADSWPITRCRVRSIPRMCRPDP